MTRKKIRKIPIERNSAGTIRARSLYANGISRRSDATLYFLDETCFNLHTGPDYGYARKGETPTTYRPGNRRQNLSALVCIGRSQTLGSFRWRLQCRNS